MTTTTGTTDATKTSATTHNNDISPQNTTGNTFQNDAKDSERKVHRETRSQLSLLMVFTRRSLLGTKQLNSTN
eukprot:2182500-Ditylum_brightwellii.AAC.1